MLSVALALAAAVRVPSPLTMDAAVRLFREHGFDLISARGQALVSEGDARAAAALPNPQVSGSISHSPGYDAACAGCSATGFAVGVTDPALVFDVLTGKRGLRSDAVRAAVAAARGTRDDVLRTAGLALRQAVLDLALLEAQARVAADVAASTDRTRALDQRRFAAGAISEAELARADVAALSAEQAREAAAQAVTAARLQLSVLLGADAPTADFEVDPGVLATPGPTSSVSVEEAEQNRPDLRAARQAQARAEAQLSLARRQRIPDVALSAQYQQEGSSANAITPPTWTFGLQLPVPLFYQQQGEVLRAEGDLIVQRAQAEKVHAQVRADVLAASASVQTARRLVERMNTLLLERAQRARDLARVQYEKGAASLLELLDAERAWAQTRADYLKDLHDYWLAVYQLDAAMGRT